MRIHLLLLTVFLAPALAQAEPICTPTTRVAAEHYPGAKAIPTGNNLLQPAGKAVAAEGQKITIQGRVVDKNCAPVQEAIVELWQNSPTGRWLLAGAEDLANPNPIFAGAGRTYTDNDGRFTFITAFPAPLAKRAPFVNIKVSGQGIPDLSTALYFSGDARNAGDAGFAKLKGKFTTIAVEQGENGELTGSIELVIGAKAPYRVY